MSPKEKVRANIYKELLKQEKAKNKKISIFTVCFLFVGVVATSTYNHINNNRMTKNYYSLISSNNLLTQDNKFYNSEYELATDVFYDFKSDKNSLTLSADEFFGFKNQI